VTRGFTRRRKQNSNRGDPERLPSLFTFLTGGDSHRYLQKKKHNKQLILVFFSPLGSVLGSVFSVCYSFLLLPMQICYGVWSDSPATCTVEDTLGPGRSSTLPSSLAGG
jgi:hypothetical protein